MLRAASPLVDHPPQPVDLVLRACRVAGHRRLKARQLEVSMRIDEPGHDRHVAQIQVSGAFPGRAHPADPPLLKCHHSVLDGRTLHREDIARLESERVSSHRLSPVALALRPRRDPLLGVQLHRERAHTRRPILWIPSESRLELGMSRKPALTINFPQVKKQERRDQPAECNPDPMIKTLGRIAIEPRRDSSRLEVGQPRGLCDRKRVVQEVKDDAGQHASAPNRQQAQDDAQECRIEELLEQAHEHVKKPEHQGREQDRRAGAAAGVRDPRG